MSKKMVLAPSLGLDFSADASRAGFRLDRVEVYNWGTFDGRVHTLSPNGYNMLVTGDKGSGKSTLADAIQALLCAPKSGAFNQASGGEANDRTLRSYFEGYYRSERNEAQGGGKPISLRDGKHYSVILASFYNEGFDQRVSLAIVYFQKEGQTQPARFYVGAEQDLTVSKDFTQFGADLSALKKRLRAQGCMIEDSFVEYSAWFRRRLGIKSPQAMELFHQTVSMKEVPNLTDFVRKHMLEPLEVEPLLSGLMGHYDTLTRSHDAILRAKRQYSLLEPLVSECDRFDTDVAERDRKVALREAITPAFNIWRSKLLGERVKTLESERDSVQRELTTRQTEREQLDRAIHDLHKARLENGGGRIESLTADIGRLEEAKADRKNRADSYAQRLASLDLSPASNSEDFAALRTELKTQWRALDTQVAALEEQLAQLSTQLQGQREQLEARKQAIRSLKSRTSNIEERQILVRAALCEQLELNVEDIPFVGELIQVRDDEVDWEGAAERVLGGFATSLLVQEEHYARVSDWIDRTPLHGIRVVYYRVRSADVREPRSLHPLSLVRKLEVKDGTFAPWLRGQLALNYNCACCETLEDFRREPYALTQAGQVKYPSGRHEKDDRFDIHDRSQYVLGWSNAGKIEALERQADVISLKMTALATEHERIRRLRQGHHDRLTLLAQLSVFERFEDIDWQSTARRIASLDEERTRLASSSDVLKQISAELERSEQLRQSIERAINELRGTHAVHAKDLERANSEWQVLEKTIGTQPVDDPTLTTLESLRSPANNGQRLTYFNCPEQSANVRKGLQSEIDALNKRLSSIQGQIVQKMGAFKGAFPLESSEMDARVEAAKEYRDFFARLVADDLPRFEARFKNDLNENTINEIVNFSAQLDVAQSSIKKRIDLINKSMAQIDYAPGRYLVLLAEPGIDVEVKEFRTALKACTEGSLLGSEDDQYSEAKFLQVKSLIDRFKGRPERAEEDARWTRKVTDVRNWFQFAAMERWRADNSDYEYYESSGGKSGGQKETLAYTVLAAALAYQFGLEFGEKSSRAFRFVMIDEAFSRGTDESVHHCLSLLEKLGLQVLVVTPLQKITAIEQHVARVVFVHIVDNKRSFARNLTLDQYREEKAKVQLS